MKLGPAVMGRGEGGGGGGGGSGAERTGSVSLSLAGGGGGGRTDVVKSLCVTNVLPGISKATAYSSLSSS